MRVLSIRRSARSASPSAMAASLTTCLVDSGWRFGVSSALTSSRSASSFSALRGAMICRSCSVVFGGMHTNPNMDCTSIESQSPSIRARPMTRNASLMVRTRPKSALGFRCSSIARLASPISLDPSGSTSSRSVSISCSSLSRKGSHCSSPSRTTTLPSSAALTTGESIHTVSPRLFVSRRWRRSRGFISR